jgi:hypothetical protein
VTISINDHLDADIGHGVIHWGNEVDEKWNQIKVSSHVDRDGIALGIVAVKRPMIK